MLRALALGSTVVLALLAACGSSQKCVPGQQVTCACPGGSKGAQACSTDGSAFGACDCGGSPLPVSTGNGGTFLAKLAP